jgi:hypothetical protein
MKGTSTVTVGQWKTGRREHSKVLLGPLMAIALQNGRIQRILEWKNTYILEYSKVIITTVLAQVPSVSPSLSSPGGFGALSSSIIEETGR